MMKSSTSFGFSSSLFFFFIVVSIVVYSEAADDCLYRLAVKTGNDAKDGTDSIIGVKLANPSVEFGESVEIPDLLKWGKMSSGHEYFKNGNLDIFLVPAPSPCLPVITWINVTSDGSGHKPKWYLEYVKAIVLFASPLTETKFEFDQWLAIDEIPYELTATRVTIVLSTKASTTFNVVPS